jgi:predicted DNA-binding antitoxin AbrB/MazE fold protein
MVSIRAIYENGALRLLEPLDLQEGEQVEIIITPKPEVAHTKQGKRKLELFRGEFWMSDDFDDLLPDTFWLSEDEQNSI